MSQEVRRRAPAALLASKDVKALNLAERAHTIEAQAQTSAWRSRWYMRLALILVGAFLLLSRTGLTAHWPPWLYWPLAWTCCLYPLNLAYESGKHLVLSRQQMNLARRTRVALARLAARREQHIHPGG